MSMSTFTPNTSAACEEPAKRFVCLAMLPSCEVGSQTRTLCPSDARTAFAACGDHNEALSRAVMELLPGSDRGSCFHLDYEGPNVALWALAVAISVLFSPKTAVGLNMQKRSMRLERARGGSTPPTRQPMWIAGFCLTSVGAVLDFAVFGMAPLVGGT